MADCARDRQPACDAARIAELTRGDERAWTDFLTDYHAVFQRAILRAAFYSHFRVDANLVDELVCQLMCSFYDSIRMGTFQYYGEAGLRCYLLRIAEHLVAQRLRQLRRAARLHINSDPESPDLATVATNQWLQAQTAAGGPRAEALSECLTGLAHTAREVVYLRHIHDEPFTLAEIATMRQESVAAVEKRYQRALAALRECIERSVRRAGETA